MSEKKECYVCHTKYGLHKHHIYYGKNRKNSEKYGCWCYLCGKDHNLSSAGVHFNIELDNSLKRECRKKWDALGRSRNEFFNIFGKYYE